MAEPRDIDEEVMHDEEVRAAGHESEHQLPTLAAHDADPLETEDMAGEEDLHSEEPPQDEDADGVHGADYDETAEHLPAGDGSAEQPAHAAAPDEPTGPLKHWYIIHAYSGFENKVAESLQTRARAFGFDHRLGQLLIPTEEVIELRNGKKVTSKRLLYPGYVLVEMEMDDELWHAVKSTPRVTGFVGGGTKPVPLTADEVNAVLYRQASSAERPRPKMTFEKNESVKIVDGPFTNFSGKVDEINMERNTLRVMVTIFGRSTPVELDFLQVEKI